MTDFGSRPVVVTRPLAQSQLFAQQILAIGREPVIFPLLEIAALEDDGNLRAALATLARYAMVVFVSPNAVDATFRLIGRWPQDVAIGVVGDGSRQALQRHGVTGEKFRIVAPGDSARMDSEGLFSALDLASLRGRRVLIVRGQAGRDFLSDMLRAGQVEVDHVAAYRRLPPLMDQARIRQLGALLDADSEWVVTSSEALRHLVRLTAETCGACSVVKLQRQRMIVSHHRIAETAHSLGFSHVTLTGSGDERLIAALQSGQ